VYPGTPGPTSRASPLGPSPPKEERAPPAPLGGGEACVSFDLRTSVLIDALHSRVYAPRHSSGVKW
jgi:hypothetical protein